MILYIVRDEDMFYIKLLINNECKYLLNHRAAVYCWGYAKAFRSAEAAQKYCRGHRLRGSTDGGWWRGRKDFNRIIKT